MTTPAPELRPLPVVCDGVGYSLFARADKPLARDLEVAKRRLGVVSEKTSFGPDGQWFWALPLVGGVQ